MDLYAQLKRVLGLAKQGKLKEAGGELIDAILHVGINGAGQFKGAVEVAHECRRHSQGDVEDAIRRTIRTHRRIVTTAGFAAGFGGLPVMAVSVPVDVTVLYVQATRMTASVAHLRGYDVNSEEVKSLIAVSLLGAAGTEVLAKAGVNIGGKMSVAALRKLPAKVLTKINQAVGFRLLTKFGVKGAINLSKAVPVVSSGIGAGINAAGITTIATYAKRHFPAIASVEEGLRH